MNRMISMDVIDLDDLRRGKFVLCSSYTFIEELLLLIAYIGGDPNELPLPPFAVAQEAQDDEVTVLSNEPGAVYPPFAGRK